MLPQTSNQPNSSVRPRLIVETELYKFVKGPRLNNVSKVRKNVRNTARKIPHKPKTLRRLFSSEL